MNKNELVVAGFNREQVDLIKSNVAKGATDMELSFFLHTAKRVGLDPLTKQIHFVKRAGQMTVQTGIDGFRAIADRTGKLAGIDDPVFDSEEGKNPQKATVTVYKMIEGQKMPFTASARWSEYAPAGTQAFMWNKMPYLMLGKCAESLALRKAFPNDLSGLYSNEEMAQAHTTEEYDTSPIQEDVVVVSTGDDTPGSGPRNVKKEQAQKRQIKELVDSITLVELSTKEEYEDYVSQNTGLKLSPENFDAIIKKLTKTKMGEEEPQ